MPDDPLYLMNPLGRFSERADAYARYRPDYPTGAFNLILDGLGDPAGLVVADLGAGTGISSRQLADRGPQVIAVEPNEAMRLAAEKHDRVRFVDGTGEATGLPDRSVHLATAFQAFHWFDPHRALEEIRRILVPGGRLGVAWNERSDDDAFTAEYTSLIRRASANHPAERRAALLEIPLEDHGFTNERRHAVPHRQSLDLAGVLGRAASTSYLPADGPQREELVHELTELHGRRCDAEGRVSLIYRTTVCLSEVTT